ncbi:hypothetical protein [Micromonospora sp. NPDC005206]|uniref:hypothetical protein n=1 Tax=Micromonospora sp. NPDC005206 TaxID=3157022 RepID=UPI0033A7314B
MEPLWMTYAGFIFDVLASLAGVVAILFAVKAYKVSVRGYEVSAESYRVAKEQGRKAYEVETLRQLSSWLDRYVNDAADGSGDAPLLTLTPEAFLRLPLLRAGELPTWEFVAKPRELAQVKAFLLSHPFTKLWATEAIAESEDEILRDRIKSILVVSMFHELNEAAIRRTA